MNTDKEGFDLEVKLAIYRHFAATGVRPSCEEIAAKVAGSASEVAEAYQRLRAQRVLVLEDDGVSIRMAPPFSGVATQHVVKAEGRSYFANCAWDALGIPAALGKAATVHSRCEQSIEALRLEVGVEGRRQRTGCFIAWCRRRIGGTTLCSREATCCSSGRKKKWGNGVARGDIRGGRSCAWISCGCWRGRGIPRDCSRIRGGRGRMRCGRSLRVAD